LLSEEHNDVLQNFLRRVYLMKIKTKYENGAQKIYIEPVRGQIRTYITIEDGKLPGYSMVPKIKDYRGNEQHLIILLNWITARLKSPIVTTKYKPFLFDYGFVYRRRQWVWDSVGEELVG
jgi:hypothetical protein